MHAADMGRKELCRLSGRVAAPTTTTSAPSHDLESNAVAE